MKILEVNKYEYPYVYSWVNLTISEQDYTKFLKKFCVNSKEDNSEFQCFARVRFNSVLYLCKDITK
jgi:hypothetical protein